MLSFPPSLPSSQTKVITGKQTSDKKQTRQSPLIFLARFPLEFEKYSKSLIIRQHRYPLTPVLLIDDRRSVVESIQSTFSSFFSTAIIGLSQYGIFDDERWMLKPLILDLCILKLQHWMNIQQWFRAEPNRENILL